MDILKHFLNSREDGLIIFSLKDEEWNDLLNKLPVEFRECFIPINELNSRIKIFEQTKEEELAEILPTKGSIKSGDFGEILAYLLFKEIYKNKKIDGPKKWRWKENQNVAAPYSDVILFSIKNESKYSKEDLIISAESKMKAVVKNTSTPIQNAINGAQKDHVSRIANSLSWLRKKYKDESLKEGAEKDKLIQLVKNINRFIESEKAEHGEYKKEVKAIAFVDQSFLQEEKTKSITLPNEIGLDLEVYVVGIKDLKKMYEKVYSKIPQIG